MITSVKYHVYTFKSFTLSFGVMNFQTISKLKNSLHMNIYEMRANMQVVHFAKPENLKSNAFKKSPEIHQIAKPKYL